MISARSGAVACVLAVAGVVAYAQSSQGVRPWPPGVQQVAGDSPALPPAEVTP